MPNLGNPIRKLFINSRLSIDSLEKIIGINNIQKYEVDTTLLVANAIIALVTFFDVSWDQLLWAMIILRKFCKSDFGLNAPRQLLQELCLNRSDNVATWIPLLFKRLVKNI